MLVNANKDQTVEAIPIALQGLGHTIKNRDESHNLIYLESVRLMPLVSAITYFSPHTPSRYTSNFLSSSVNVKVPILDLFQTLFLVLKNHFK